MPAVSLDAVTKMYGEDTVALDGVDLDIEQGEFVVLLGPSGAGKSTLLRVLNGLTEPTAGEARINGAPATSARSEVGMVFQMHYLVENMSAFRNALTGALSRAGFVRSLLTLYDRADKEAALEALDTVGLLDEAEQRAGSMSGGQKQRVGIARALVQNPNLLLADEPVSSLDPKAARDVMRYLKTAADERELTTLVSLHQVNIAREFGDRFVGIKNGRVFFDGTREELSMDVVDELYYGADADAPDRLSAESGSDGGGETAAGTDDAGTEVPTGEASNT